MSSTVRRILQVLLGLWLVGGVVLGGALLVHHLIALPTPPPTSAALHDQMRQLFARPWSDDGKWHALHVMYRACPCSQRTIAHLTERARPADLDELVLIVDDEGKPGEEERALEARGYRVAVTTPERLRRELTLEAAPVLVIARPGGEVVYVGGYTRHKQSNAYEDLAILSDLRRQQERGALPVFGCPTSERLARQLDPLRLRP